MLLYIATVVIVLLLSPSLLSIIAAIVVVIIAVIVVVTIAAIAVVIIAVIVVVTIASIVVVTISVIVVVIVAAIILFDIKEKCVEEEPDAGLPTWMSWHKGHRRYIVSIHDHVGPPLKAWKVNFSAKVSKLYLTITVCMSDLAHIYIYICLSV